MHFFELIKQISANKGTKIYVDMDGVIASFNIGKPYDFGNKRPIQTNINTLKKISGLENVELHILSICRTDNQIAEKNNWLDKYAPFFDKNNRNILSKETYPNLSSKELKANFLKKLNKDKQIILIDDDNGILKYIAKEVESIILFQDSELVD